MKMTRALPNQKLLIGSLLLTSITAIVLNSGYIYNIWLFPTGKFLLLPDCLWMIALMLALFLTPTGLIASLIRRFDSISLTIFLCASVYILISVSFSGLASRIQIDGYAQLLAEHEQVVTAIEQYQVVYGSPPESLDQLTPFFLSDFPRKLGPHFANYSYLTGEEAAEVYPGNNWVLEFDIQVPYLDYAFFVYLPEQNYPDDVRRVGDRGYIGRG